MIFKAPIILINQSDRLILPGAIKKNSSFNFDTKRIFFISKIISKNFRIRYLILAYGGYYLNKKYHEIKKPFTELGRYVPERKNIDNFVFFTKSKIYNFSDFNKNFITQVLNKVAETYTGFDGWIRKKSTEIYIPETKNVDNLIISIKSKIYNFSDFNKSVVSQVFNGVGEKYKYFKGFIIERSTENYVPDRKNVENLVILMKSKIYDFSDLNKVNSISKSVISQVYNGVGGKYKSFEGWIREKSEEITQNSIENIVIEDKAKEEEIDLFKIQLTTLENYFAVPSDSIEDHTPELTVIQRFILSKALNDIPIKSETEWDTAVKFLSSTLDDHLSSIKKLKDNLKGPGFVNSWIKWKGKSTVQLKRCAVFDEVTKILDSEPNHKMVLSPEEITTIKRNLKMKKIEVDSDFIRDLWHISYRESLFLKASSRVKDCENGFYGFAENADFDCHDVVFFRRILRMLETSGGALRNQIINNEMRRMESIVKEVLEENEAGGKKLNNFLVGDKIELAENLNRKMENNLNDEETNN